MYRQYNFTKDDAYRFAEFVGIKTFPHGDELDFKKCPYCQQTGGGRDKRTFGINLNTGVFHCFRASCGRKGNMITLAQDFDFKLTGYEEQYKPLKNNYKVFDAPEKKPEPKPKVVKYLLDRGISEEVIAEYEVGNKSDSDSIIAFLHYDPEGKIAFIKYRNTEKSKMKEFCEKGMKPVLFGIKQCKNRDYLVITEGQIDCLSARTAGIENVVSVPNGAKGFTWVRHCYKWVEEFEKIIVFGDFEKGHMSLIDEIKARFDGQPIYQVREEDYKDCKDANDILRKYGPEQVQECIKNAELVPIDNVMDLADVKNVDINSIDKVPTKVKAIDRLLYGGLPFGGLTIITSKSGKGKSTFASQILLSALENDNICFAYSGELPNYLFKRWLDFQIAGNHVTTYQDSVWHDNRYTISEYNQSLINEWYRGKIYIHDNTMIKDESKSLLETAENAIKQYGVSVLLFDNLMTAMSENRTTGEDKYDRQGRFVSSLVKMALKYKVCIILIAHKRKNNFSTDDSDEIAGSSDINNLASVTLSYDMSQDLEQTQRLLKLSKNRLVGKIDMQGVVLNFDEKSKRIYEVDADYGYDVACFKDSDGFAEVSETDEELPF